MNYVTGTYSLEAAAHEAALEDGLIAPPSKKDGVGSSASVNLDQMKMKKAGLRRGKWTTEEEFYANRLIYEFKLGLLPLTDGTTLRTFLSKLLNCDPMRISKKFVGQNCIGKQVFRRRQQDLEKLTTEQIECSRKELAELERKFLERVAQTNRTKTSGNGVKFKDGKIGYDEDGNSHPVLAPWMMPPEDFSAAATSNSNNQNNASNMPGSNNTAPNNMYTFGSHQVYPNEDNKEQRRNSKSEYPPNNQVNQPSSKHHPQQITYATYVQNNYPSSEQQSYPLQQMDPVEPRRRNDKHFNQNQPDLRSNSDDNKNGNYQNLESFNGIFGSKTNQFPWPTNNNTIANNPNDRTNLVTEESSYDLNMNINSQLFGSADWRSVNNLVAAAETVENFNPGTLNNDLSVLQSMNSLLNLSGIGQLDSTLNLDAILTEKEIVNDHNNHDAMINNLNNSDLKAANMKNESNLINNSNNIHINPTHITDATSNAWPTSELISDLKATTKSLEIGTTVKTDNSISTNVSVSNVNNNKIVNNQSDLLPSDDGVSNIAQQHYPFVKMENNDLMADKPLQMQNINWLAPTGHPRDSSNAPNQVNTTSHKNAFVERNALAASNLYNQSNGHLQSLKGNNYTAPQEEINTNIPSKKSLGIPQNSSVDNFWMLVDMGDLPRPDSDVLSETLWQGPKPGDTADVKHITLQDDIKSPHAAIAAVFSHQQNSKPNRIDHNPNILHKNNNNFNIANNTINHNPQFNSTTIDNYNNSMSARNANLKRTQMEESLPPHDISQLYRNLDQSMHNSNLINNNIGVNGSNIVNNMNNNSTYYSNLRVYGQAQHNSQPIQLFGSNNQTNSFDSHNNNNNINNNNNNNNNFKDNSNSSMMDRNNNESMPYDVMFPFQSSVNQQYNKQTTNDDKLHMVKKVKIEPNNIINPTVSRND
eukprot:gene5265-7316_t